MSVRVSPISRTAAILIIVVGVFVLFTGLVAGDLVSEVAGVSFVAQGIALYGQLFRFTRKLKAEVGGANR